MLSLLTLLFCFLHHALFFAETQCILFHFGIALRYKRFCVMLRFNLCKCAVAGCFHLCDAARYFQFQKNHAAFAYLHRLHHDVGSAVSALTIGPYQITADVHKKSCHKSVVEILGIIVIADGVHKLTVNEVLRSFAVARFQCPHEWAAVGLFYSLLKPVSNRIFLNRLNFRIRNCHA